MHLRLSIKRHYIVSSHLYSRQNKSLMFAKFRGYISGAQDSPCDTCTDPCFPAEPGTVTPHNYHVLLRLPSPSNTSPTTWAPDWWPETIDNHPAIVAINTALKTNADSIDGKVKVTAFDYINTTMQDQDGEGKGIEMLVLSTTLAKHYSNLTCSTASSALISQLTSNTNNNTARDINELLLIVCCHTKRDARCGQRGPALAHKLHQVALKQGIKATVIASSHVGGHKYAANVLVHGLAGLSGGHWFGGLEEGDGEEFLKELNKVIIIKAEVGGNERIVESSGLRKWWRGCVGLSKDEQRAKFELKEIENLSN